MLKISKGFTAIEFVIGLLILAIAAGIVVPGFACFGPNLAPYGVKAKEAEVKSNIHTIQIALERYAVDTGGIYPSFLVGAEANYNIIRAQYEPRYASSAKIASGATPFAKSRNAPASQQNCFITMDPLIQYGYLSEYPENPFAKRDAGLWNASLTTGSDKSGLFPFGGLHGDKMFDLGFGWGDTPQTDYILTTSEGLDEREDSGKADSPIIADPDLDAPGDFYYHPIFADGLPVYTHYLSQYLGVYNDAESSSSPFPISKASGNNEVVGYHLCGYGWGGAWNLKTIRGVDLFNRMPPGGAWVNRNKFTNIKLMMANYKLVFGFEMDSTVKQSQMRVETTGYPASEYDPWTNAFPDGIDPGNPSEKHNISGPDGIKDWVIIKVSSFLDYRSSKT